MKLKGLLIAAFLFSVPAVESFAQDEVIAVPIHKGVFKWDWEQGIGDMADFFTVRCTPQGTTEVLEGSTNGLVKELPVNAVITNRGTYDCHVVAVNVAGSSDPSNTVSTKIVGPAAQPTNFRIEAS